MSRKWDIPRSTLNKPDAQQRMYALRLEYDKIMTLVEGLNNQLDGIADERLSLLKAHPTLSLGRPNE